MQEITAVADIPLQNFLPIFISSALVLVFASLYVAVYTLIKVNFFSKHFHLLGYGFWLLTAYCLYLMATLIQVNHLTEKALIVAAIGLFFIPKAMFYLEDKVETENS